MEEGKNMKEKGKKIMKEENNNLGHIEEERKEKDGNAKEA